MILEWIGKDGVIRKDITNLMMRIECPNGTIMLADLVSLYLTLEYGGKRNGNVTRFILLDTRDTFEHIMGQLEISLEKRD